ncbi:MAG: GGDEF domain-containing protein [Gammaproteobacteria bacterium]
MAASWLAGSVGIKARLSVAFGAVALLAVAANLLVEHGPSMIPATMLRQTRDPAVGIIPPAEPSPPISRPDSRPLLTALGRFGLATHRRLGEQTDGAVREATIASTELSNEWSTFRRQAVLLRGGGELDKAGASLQTQLKQAQILVAAADERRRLIRDYDQAFDSLDSRIKDAIDRAWKILGRVVARQSLIEMSRSLDKIRPDLAILSKEGAGDDDVIAVIAANEMEFASTLEKNRKSLVRSQGPAWVEGLQSELTTFLKAGQALGQLNATQHQSLKRFDTANSSLSARVKAIAATSLAGAVTSPKKVSSTESPAPGPSTRARVRRHPAGQATWLETELLQDRSRLIAWLSGGVLALLLWISAATVLSILRPVRGLMLATRRLADGESDVLVPRGGIRELDALAVSFNQMAERLVAAQGLARQYHSQLEERVEERTRQLQHLAEHDPLTQLPNRRQLFVRLNTALQSAAEEGRCVGVYFLDLDNFKNINDSMGHVFGDRVLQCLAERLREVCSSFGFAVRLGGDEFTAVVETAENTDEIVAAGWELVRAFQKPLAVDGRDLSLSISVGVSFYPDHEVDAVALLRAADAALFRAKALGRGQLNVFSPDLVVAASSRFNTEQGLRRAVERGEFELFFQPEINAETAQVELVEALLRWRLPNGQYVTPVDFLPVAEDSGLIGQISDWVVRTAVETAARWHHGSWPDVRVAINISSRQLLDSNFVDDLQELLRQHQLPTGCIEIELTENVLQTGTATIQSLCRLRAAGFGIALDDFGTGYSSLVSLEQLPLSRVKLDRSLIDSIDTSARSIAIARAVIGLCNSLGMQITAEGVERPEQLHALVGNAGMYLQGYLFSPAVPESELLEVVSTMAARVQALVQASTQPSTRATQTRRALSSVR